MVKAIHIEDEPGIVQLLKDLINEHCSDFVQLCGSASSPEQAVKLINAIRPELIYLDIELKNGNAFDLLESIKDFKFEVIFITAFNDFAVRAFRLNATDYILKPIDIEELKSATIKAVNRINDSQFINKESETIKYLKANFGTKKIGLPVDDGIVFTSTDEIIHAEAKGGYTVITLSDGKKIISTKNLKDVESLLPESSFLRVHHSWIINLKYLKKYYRGKNSYMEMEDGSTIAVSIRKKGNFLDIFGA